METTHIGHRMAVVVAERHRTADVVWSAVIGYFFRSNQVLLDADSWSHMAGSLVLSMVPQNGRKYQHTFQVADIRFVTRLVCRRMHSVCSFLVMSAFGMATGTGSLVDMGTGRMIQSPASDS